MEKNRAALTQKSGKNIANWSKKKKTAAAIIGISALATVIVLVLVLVFDLGPVVPIESTEEQAAVVGTVAGFEVRFEELCYVVKINRAELDAKYGKYDTLDDSRKAQYESELQSNVYDDIKSNYVILSLCQKYGVDADSRDADKYVNDAIRDFVDEIGGKKAYKAWLAKNGMTDSLLRLVYRVAYLEGEIVEVLEARGEEIKYNEDNLKDFVDFVMTAESYVKVIHAFYPKDWKYSDGKSSIWHARAELEKLNSAKTDSERFSIMKSAIGNAPFVSGYSVMGSDYYITYGQMHEKYEEIAFSLDEYEASEILELEEGYYILMRVPKDKDQVGPRANEFLVYYKYAVLKQLADAHRGEIEFVGNDYFNSLDLLSIN
ncbi:MAG: hypothetical protein IJC64_00300 [Clostridia bacterium]|nr:hypothetical protein [Clostridia bacterium]